MALSSTLMVLPYANLGGTERHVWFLARALASRGVPVRCALPEGPAEGLFEACGIPTVRLPRPSVGSFLKLIGVLRREIRLMGKDQVRVHVHAAMELVLAARWAEPAATRVYSCHGFHSELDYRKAGLFLNGSCSATIAVSAVERERLLAGGLVAEHCHVVPGAVDGPDLREGTTTLRQELGLAADALVVGALCRLDRYKGIDILLRALPSVLRQHPQVVLVVGGDGPERAPLMRLAAQLGVAHRVHWLGRVEDPGALLRALDLFALPTRAESFGMAPLEAMACGVPVVVTELPALAESVRDGEDGLLMSPKAGLEVWAEAISGLLADGDRRARLGRSARQRADAFSLEALADRTLAVYEAAERG